MKKIYSLIYLLSAVFIISVDAKDLYVIVEGESDYIKHFVALSTVIIVLLLGLAFIYKKNKDEKQDLETKYKNEIENIKQQKEQDDIVKAFDKTHEMNMLLDAFDRNVIASKTDMRGVITYVSKAFCDISGYKEDELLGKNHNIVRHPDMPEESFEGLWHDLKHKGVWRGEVKNRKKDDGYYWVDVVITPEYNILGEKIGYSAIRQDITSKKELDELSRELENRVEQRTQKIADLLNNAGQGFLSFQKDFLIDQEYSKECEKLLEPELENKDISIVLFKDDIEKQNLFKSIFNDIELLDDDFMIESFLSLLPDEIELNSKVLKLEYKLLGCGKFMLVITNITTQKQLEKKVQKESARLKMIVAVVSDSENFYDIKNDYLEFSKNYLEIIDHKKRAIQNLNELYRIVHTFKGAFLQLFMQNSASMLHEIENQISKMIQDTNNSNESVTEFLESIDFESFISTDLKNIQNMLGESFLNNSSTIKVNLQEVKSIEQKLALLINKVPTEHKDIESIMLDIQKLSNIKIMTILGSYPKMVQQISHRLQKEIYDFEVIGDESIIVSKSYKPFLKSLIHVFRNSIDHGIEDPESRLEKGKDEIGSVACSFIRENGELIITISDDGAGIDKDKIKSKLSEVGLFVDDMNDSEIYASIFNDNFTTKDKVSEISGRGVGMSAVKGELEKLNGTYKINTQKDIGTTFIFRLP
jgi:two-component system chemotaxis sensor kinase CheA